MTASTARPEAQGPGVRAWLAARHSLCADPLAVLILYGSYEAARGLVSGDRTAAERHAHDVVALEQSLHLFVERGVQSAARSLPGLIDVLGVAYFSLHLTVTGAVLLWLHRRRPNAFPPVRTTLLLASGIALVGFLAFPTAPPRLAHVGVLDTVSRRNVDLNHGLVSSLYNPYAAIPSMHVAYAIVVGATLVRFGGRTLLRVAGALYPLFVLLVIVATGNHFVVDAAAGVAVAGLAWLAARAIQGERASAYAASVASVTPGQASRSSARRLPASPRRLRSSRSASSRSSAARSALASRGGTSRPVSPSATRSSSPPTADATTGLPYAIASAQATPKPSRLDGHATTAARSYSRPSSSCGTKPSACGRSERSGPSPATTSGRSRAASASSR